METLSTPEFVANDRSDFCYYDTVKEVSKLSKPVTVVHKLPLIMEKMYASLHIS